MDQRMYFCEALTAKMPESNIHIECVNHEEMEAMAIQHWRQGREQKRQKISSIHLSTKWGDSVQTGSWVS